MHIHVAVMSRLDNNRRANCNMLMWLVDCTCHSAIMENSESPWPSATRCKHLMVFVYSGQLIRCAKQARWLLTPSLSAASGNDLASGAHAEARELTAIQRVLGPRSAHIAPWREKWCHGAFASPSYIFSTLTHRDFDVYSSRLFCLHQCNELNCLFLNFELWSQTTSDLMSLLCLHWTDVGYSTRMCLPRTESSNVEPYLDMYARARSVRRSECAAQGCTQIAFQSQELESSVSENTYTVRVWTT